MDEVVTAFGRTGKLVQRRGHGGAAGPHRPVQRSDQRLLPPRRGILAKLRTNPARATQLLGALLVLPHLKVNRWLTEAAHKVLACVGALVPLIGRLPLYLRYCDQDLRDGEASHGRPRPAQQ